MEDVASPEGKPPQGTVESFQAYDSAELLQDRTNAVKDSPPAMEQIAPEWRE